MTARIGRPLDHVKEQFWRRTIADQAHCGLSIKAYCQREGLEVRNFHRWRQVLARRDHELLSAQTACRPDSSTVLARSSAFLPVRVIQNAAEPMTSTTPIEIVPRSGPTVRVTRGFDPQTLDLVLSLLEARRC
jgi:transposase